MASRSANLPLAVRARAFRLAALVILVAFLCATAGPGYAQASAGSRGDVHGTAAPKGGKQWRKGRKGKRCRRMVLGVRYRDGRRKVKRCYVSGAYIKDRSIKKRDLARNSVTSSRVANDSLTAADLAQDSVTASELDDAAVVGGRGGTIAD